VRADPGDIVRLAEFEDQPQQIAIVLHRRPIREAGHPQMYLVQLRPEDRDPSAPTGDDGLRELTEDQIVEILWRDPEDEAQKNGNGNSPLRSLDWTNEKGAS